MLAVLVFRLGLQMNQSMVFQLSTSTHGYIASDVALLMSMLVRNDELAVAMDKVEDELLNTRPTAIDVMLLFTK